MKILVTGGAGYIGSTLSQRLLDCGHRVTVLDRFIYDNETSIAQLCKHPDFDVFRVDCRDMEAVAPHLKDADVIIPLAGLVGVPLGDLNPTDAKLLNLDAQLALFKALSPSQLVIMPTTESSYGKNAAICTEETPLNPLSTYAKHKVTVENALMERENSVSLRLATVFGMSPRMRLDLLVNDFTWRAYKEKSIVIFEGSYKRTSVHVTDVARAFIHALTLNPGIYNVGAVVTTKLELCEAIRKHIPEFVWIEADTKWDTDQRNYVVSDAKIRATGFEPKVTLDAGITELLKGFKMLSNNKYGNV